MEDATSASVLATYREMISDPQKCDILCKDKECLMFLVYMLKDQDDDIITESLNILLTICETTSHSSAVSTTFGIIPSLNLLISSNNNRDIQISARKLRRLISSQIESESALPLQEFQNQEFSLRTPTRPRFLGAANSRAKTVILKIIGLESKVVAHRQLCEDELVTVKGVISITFDLKKGYCFVRARSGVKTALLAEAVQRTKTMSAQEVVRNEIGEEVFVPFSPSSNDGGPNTSANGDPLPYLPEKDSPVKENAVVQSKRDLKRTTIHLLASAANFLSRSLYW